MLGIGGAGVVIGASGVGSIFSLNQCLIHQKMKRKMHMSFMAKFAGITTPTQRSINFVALDLKSKDKAAIKDMFKQWTKMAAQMTDGDSVGKESSNPLLPPVDTGEAIGLSASKLTLTFE